MSNNTMQIPAIEIRQGKGRPLYSFGIDGKKLLDIAQISRIGRNEEAKITGYQRPEVISHIKEIRAYLETESAILPNAIVVAFNTSVTFEPLKYADANKTIRHGMLTVPRDISEGVERPGWIVDGQQRSAAIRDADIKEFPVFVTAFITDSIAEQKEQFILVNSTKPLPQGLIFELLPDTAIRLSSKYEKRKISTTLLQMVITDMNSPFYRAIQTPTNIEGFIKDNSFLKMVENSLNDGALYKFKTFKEPDASNTQSAKLLNIYWSAVKSVFNDSWGLRPNKTRLSHGVGIVSLGYLMDAICDKFRTLEMPPFELFCAELTSLKPYCAWNSGEWRLGGDSTKKWDDVQNISKDIELISNFLLTKFKYKA
ncbi:MAG: DGQHR domain-containing protein DpdB [Candidatus Pacebacteria bacterium]|nr:DGQHR domain-containing protein DpdB [Candidatus Paceibacterota bacterium]